MKKDDFTCEETARASSPVDKNMFHSTDVWCVLLMYFGSFYFGLTSPSLAIWTLNTSQEHVILWIYVGLVVWSDGVAASLISKKGNSCPFGSVNVTGLTTLTSQGRWWGRVAPLATNVACVRISNISDCETSLMEERKETQQIGEHTWEVKNHQTNSPMELLIIDPY